MQPQVSIITPLFNGANFIEKTITNVLSQEYSNFEWIIVDDKSSDISCKIVKTNAQKDSRIILIELDENKGAAVARNKAIELAKGRYIAFLDSDDLWHKEKLENQIKFMKTNKIDFSYTWYNKIDSNNGLIRAFKPIKHLTYKRALRYNPLHTSSVIYNCEKLGKIYMPNIRKRQDYGMWLKILKKVDGYCLEETLSYYVQRGDSLSSKKINLVKFNWDLYRKVERFGVLKSLYYLCWDIASKLLKIK